MRGPLQPYHLHPLAPDLWTATRPHSFFGLPVGARMNVQETGGKALLRDGYAWLLRAGG